MILALVNRVSLAARTFGNPSTGGSGVAECRIVDVHSAIDHPDLDSRARSILSQRQQVPGIGNFVQRQRVTQQRTHAPHRVQLDRARNLQQFRGPRVRDVDDQAVEHRVQALDHGAAFGRDRGPRRRLRLPHHGSRRDPRTRPARLPPGSPESSKTYRLGTTCPHIAAAKQAKQRDRFHSRNSPRGSLPPKAKYVLRQTAAAVRLSASLVPASI